MRGRTLEDAYVILDEAQNTTDNQMKMFLTRLGFNSKMIITGDVTQIDLPRGVESGLVRAMDILNNVKRISFIHLTAMDVTQLFKELLKGMRGNMNRILIIEDDISINKILSHELKNKDYQVDSLYDGKEACQKILSNEYDLVLVDWMLPYND